MNSYIFRPSINRISSTRTFEEYRETEASLYEAPRAVTKEGDLLDYETLELRVHPPNIRIKIEESATLITLDSANRPGTLIEVVQCLTELGLTFVKARITSDGGWFVDEFYVTDSDGPLRDPQKIKTIEKVLNINLEVDESIVTDAGIERGACRIIELIGQDSPGLLAEITAKLSDHACEAWSASIWTAGDRATFVLGVNDAMFPLSEAGNWFQLKDALHEKMGGKAANAVVQLASVKHPSHVHHERRLHRLMLQDELRSYEEEKTHLQPTTKSADILTTSAHPLPSRASLAPPFPSHDHISSAAGLPTATSGRSSGDSGHLHGTGTTEEVDMCGCNISEHLPDDYQIEVTHAPYRRYWFVRVHCHDRDKLLFDLVCTFVDLDYDVFHASLDTESGMSTLECYIRPRLGGSDFDSRSAARLGAMLKSAIFRRLPKGVPLRLVTPQMRSNGGSAGPDIAALTRELLDAGMVITRASYKPCRGRRGHTEHMTFVASMSGDTVDPAALHAACCRAGLSALTPSIGSSSSAIAPQSTSSEWPSSVGSIGASAQHSHMGNAWFAILSEAGEDWGVGSAGSSSSAQSRFGR